MYTYQYIYTIDIKQKQKKPFIERKTLKEFDYATEAIMTIVFSSFL